jgi:hypothetical protein
VVEVPFLGEGEGEGEEEEEVEEAEEEGLLFKVQVFKVEAMEEK